jgi:hypothetical protein
MWILYFLPDAVILWFTNLLLFAGVALTVAGFFIHRIPFPLIYQYQLPFKIVGIVLLVLGVYFRGGYAIEMTWRERVAEVEAQLKTAQQESARVNTVIEQKIVYRDKIIRQQGETIIQKVDNVITVEKDCRLPQEAIDVHNEAAQMNKIIEQQRKGQK